jgi:hypothetical protein
MYNGLLINFLFDFPFYKEELNVSIKFENEDELFNITYTFFQNKKKLNSD